ncbi:peptidoglycan-binding protein [Bacillaceae bacterium Marseille-Q3522]|nr:peptidoglycan-binding protein [Bacillaceae bacterium Marseille-Q3522]
MKKRSLVLVMISCLFTGAVFLYSVMQLTGRIPNTTLSSVNLQAESNSEIAKIEQAFYLIKDKYLEQVDGDTLIEGAIQGMLETLNDPYSVYMDKETAVQFHDTLESSFQGIGAEISSVDGKIIIVAPFKDSPAEKAGLKPNDQILTVDGVHLQGMDVYEATKHIRGKKGTVAELEIIRTGLSDPIKLKITRDEIPQITVRSEIKRQENKNLAYIEIATFSKQTAKEFNTQLQELEKKQLDGLIIDVRGNPGGLLESVEEILAGFVTKEKPYVQIEERNGDQVGYYSKTTKKKNYPIVVLMDKGSASAAEILAAAMKEAGGYPLIGERTFGKGTVQQAVPMGDGSNIKLTLYKWLTPDGNWIHQKGIEPDLEVKQPAIFHTHPLQLEKPLAIDMNSEQVKNAQLILKSLGFYASRTDGYFNQQTEIAVKAFQQDQGIEATGVIDPKTASLMEQAVQLEIKKAENDLQLQTAVKFLAK